ncbi:hypothetical protein CsSME_00007670 [Camellia sinensis var. sinensis]
MWTVMELETRRWMFTGELVPDWDFYSRHFNPTVLNLGRQITAMKGPEVVCYRRRCLLGHQRVACSSEIERNPFLIFRSATIANQVMVKMSQIKNCRLRHCRMVVITV